MNAALPVRRPVATAMFFALLVLLGFVALQQIPIEFLPEVEGDQLTVSFARPGSEPEIVERELLAPLESRIAVLEGVEESWGRVQGFTGSLTVRFEPGTELKVRELEMRRIGAELARTQPPGTSVDVSSDDGSEFLRNFAMLVQVAGRGDRNTVRDLIEERIEPRLIAVPGVARVLVFGGNARQVTVEIDPDRCAAVGVTPAQVSTALSRSVGRLDYVGGLEGAGGRTSVLVDGRPEGVDSLGRLRLIPGRSIELRHVASIDVGAADERMISRIDGQAAVVMVVYQEEGANLVRLGRALRSRLDELKQEFAPFGLDFSISFDGAEQIEVQLDRLKRLAVSGLIIALLVLYLFVRHWRGVAVVGIAVPVSLLAALALLYLAGQSINLVTLFALAVGVGMLVDNSIVVFEAAQRQLERGASPDAAATEGVRRTVRAILASSLTNGIVFLPVIFLDDESALLRSLLEVVAIAYLLPLAGSLVVALGLVPLLARRLAAPAALARLRVEAQERAQRAGMRAPDRAQETFVGLLKGALRRPGSWVLCVGVAVLLTILVIGPWLGFTSNQEASQADEVRMGVEVRSSPSLQATSEIFDRLAAGVRELDGVERIEDLIQEEGGSLTVKLADEERRPAETTAARVREVLRSAARDIGQHVVLTNASSGGGGGGGSRGGGLAALLGQGPKEYILSGPETVRLRRLAEDVKSGLSTIEHIEAKIGDRSVRDEIHVVPDLRAMVSRSLTPDEVLPAVGALGRDGIEMATGFTLKDGREIPLMVQREDKRYRTHAELERFRVATSSGVVELASVTDIRRMPSQPSIERHNGRRELAVQYTLGPKAPSVGPARQAFEDQIRRQVQSVHRPAGYTIESPTSEDSTRWFKKLLIPVVLLLYAILAITFESLTMPLLVLIALPLTLLGSVWTLLFTGTPLEPMAMIGALALIGLTVNPAILLVDRMQQRARVGGWSAGAAALAAVRERARPVLMTASTTIAGLWPLALVTGRENEIWPPFATIVMGGLLSSTVLTLLFIPVGFVFLRRLDNLFGRLGPWVLLGWLGTTAAIIAPLVLTETLTSLTWQVLTSAIVGGLLLALIVWVMARRRRRRWLSEEQPIEVEVRSLGKVYGRPGPVGRAWRVRQRFDRFVLGRGGVPNPPSEAWGRLAPLLLLTAAATYLAWTVQTTFWQVGWWFIAAAFGARLLRELRRARGRADALGRVEPGGPENVLATAFPWLALTYLTMTLYVLPKVADEKTSFGLWVPIALAVLTLWSQLGRRTALRVARGEVPASNLWRRSSRFLFGLDLPREQVRALGQVDFRIDHGMVGVLGPNGAGKTTLLRQLAGILDPSVGRIYLGGTPLNEIRRFLGRWVGYLPQDFGLPEAMTAKEYLDYYALLYDIEPAEREQRVTQLLEEVGLGPKAGARIGSLSGGMRQRVAVARTLLRLPRIIIVDEPTVGLDPRERIRFRNLLARLAEGRVVLFSTHVVEDVAVACSRVLVLAGGRLVFDGAPAELASAASGRIWQLETASVDPGVLAPGTRIVDQAPTDRGGWRLRLIADGRPHPEAEPGEPSLEDGYLVLTGGEKEQAA